jgi:NAD(P)-dependent dehydrogenase (short-subunit alcohol dehydrogenase family)
MTHRTVFITGAAAGIGKAIAQRFAREGWQVGLFDRDLAGVQALQRELGGSALAGALDVTDPLQWQQALSQFRDATGGRLDLLVNNAGVLSSGAFEEIPLEAHRRMIDINVTGVINGCHAAFADLKSTPNACVINLASASAMYGQPGLVTYAASKFAVRGLTEGLQLEWKPHGIRVMSIWPLFVNTAMVSGTTLSLKSVASFGVRLTPKDVADTVWRATRHEGSRTHWMVGLQSHITEPLVRWAPRPLLRWLMARLTT